MAVLRILLNELPSGLFNQVVNHWVRREFRYRQDLRGDPYYVRRRQWVIAKPGGPTGARSA